VKHAL